MQVMEVRFFTAIANNNIETAQELIDAGVDVNCKNYKGETPLILATKINHMSIIEELMKASVDLNIKDEDGDTALMCAAKNNHIDVLKRLIEFKADLDIKNDRGQSALIWAVREEKIEIVEILAKAKADIDIQDNLGDTPLLHAIYMSNPKIVKELISLGADVNKKDFDLEQSPLIAAVRREVKETIEVLVNKGANLDVQDKDGNTALHLAVMKSKAVAVRILVDAGADIKMINLRGQSIIDLAEDEEHEGVLFMLNQRKEKDQKPFVKIAEQIKEKNLPDLRAYKDDNGDNGLTILMLAGQFNRLAEKVKADPENKLEPEDLIKQNSQGQTLLSLLGQDRLLKEAFNPKLWIGRVDEMTATWKEVPTTFKNQVDIKKTVYETKRLTLQKSSRRPGRKR